MQYEERYENDAKPRLHFVAPILAWIIPGLGHWVLGYRRRALYICSGVLGLYFAGLLLGSINVINKEDAFWWYCGQYMAGPVTPVINTWRDHHQPPDDPAVDPGYIYPTPSFSRVSEVGTLYTAMAGLLNLIAILEIIYKAPCTDRKRNRREEDSSS